MKVVPMLVAACAFGLASISDTSGLELPRPEVSIHCHNFRNTEYGVGWILRPAKYELSHPRLSWDGSFVYVIADGPTCDHPWDVEVADLTGKHPSDPVRLAQTEALELAVAPSPDGQKLLLVVAEGDDVSLAVADSKGKVLAILARNVDPFRTQMKWARDGSHVYFTVPAQDGGGSTLKSVPADGGAVETLIERGVNDFDVCRTRDRVVVLSDSRIRVLDPDGVGDEFDLGFWAESVRISPDGESAALGGARLAIVSLVTGKLTATTAPITETCVLERHPAWSPSGDTVAFSREFRLNGPHQPMLYSHIVFFSLADGSEHQEWMRYVSHLDQLQWSSDGGWLIYVETPIDETGGAKPLDFKYEASLRSAPAAAQWERLAGPSTNGGILAISPADTRRLYALSRGLYISDDRGKTWRRRDVPGMTGWQPDALAVSLTDPERLYVGAANGVWRTDDGGGTWSVHIQDVQKPDLISIAVASDDPDRVYVLRESGALLRTDGQSTTTVHEFNESLMNCRLTIDPRRPRTFCIEDRPSGVAGVIYGVARLSMDRGETWRRLTPPDGAKCITSLAARSPDNEEVVCRTDTGRCYSSGDGGTTWTLYADPADPALWTEEIRHDIDALAIVPPAVRIERTENSPRDCHADPQEPSRLYGHLPGRGLHRSEDGGRTWVPANEGLGPVCVRAMYAPPDTPGALLVSFGYQSVRNLARTTDGGASWQLLANPSPRAMPWKIVACPTDPTLLFAVSDLGELYRSEDSGATWAIVPGVALIRGEHRGECFEFDEDAGRITIYSPGKLLHSVDHGRTWIVGASFFSPYDETSWRPAQVANRHAITIGQSRVGSRLFQSRDQGRSWRVVEGPFRAYVIMQMMGRPDDPAALYLLAETNTCGDAPPVLFVSRDFGSTWSARLLPDILGMTSAMARNPTSPDTIAIGSTCGAVWLSFDDGSTWQDTGAGLPRRQIDLLAFSPADHRLYAAVEDDALYTIDLGRPDSAAPR